MNMMNSTFGVNRIEAFSDGVLAIVITLLVFKIKSPELHVPTSSAEAWHALVALAPKFASFLLSFLFIAVSWVNHHRFFQIVQRSDWGLLWSNNLLLLLLCTIPFPTAFMGDHPSNPVAVALFAFLLLLAGLAFNSMWRQARRRRLIDESVGEELVSRAVTRGLVGPAAYACAALLAPFALPISWIIFLVVPLFYAWPTREQEESTGIQKETIQ
jgi:uncharacterized membrane protein